jgi:hypothetical protein
VAKLAGDSGITLSSVARTFECDRRTVGRWIQQTQEVADPGDPAETCPQPEKGWDPLCLAGLLAFLDHLAHLLGAQGFHLEPGPALASLIRWQFDQFRIVAYLTRASPPLRMAVALAVG